MFNVGGVSARMAHVSMKIHSFQIIQYIYIYVILLVYFLPQDMKLLACYMSLLGLARKT